MLKLTKWDADLGDGPAPKKRIPWTSYHIGNSLTWDSQPQAVAGMSSASGYVHRTGYHIRCGSSLVQIAADDETCIPLARDFSTWRQALAEHRFDAVTIQPHIRSTLAQDRQVILEMIDAALVGPSTPQGTTFYLYQAWPRLSEGTGPPGDYSKRWWAATPDRPDTPMVYTARYFDHLIRRVRAARPNLKIELIPVGAVFAELDRRLKTGELSIGDYKNAGDFYRDRQHLHMNAIGRFVASTTVFTVMMKKDPVGMAHSGRFFGQPDQPDRQLFFDAKLLTPEVAVALQKVVVDVVTGKAKAR